MGCGTSARGQAAPGAGAEAGASDRAAAGAGCETTARGRVAPAAASGSGAGGRAAPVARCRAGSAARPEMPATGARPGGPAPAQAAAAAPGARAARAFDRRAWRAACPTAESHRLMAPRYKPKNPILEIDYNYNAISRGRIVADLPHRVRRARRPGTEVGRLRQRRVVRMVGRGAGLPDQPPGPAGVRSPCPTSSAKARPARCGRSRRSRGSPPRRPAGSPRASAIAAQARLQLLLAAHEGRRIGDHDAEPLLGVRELVEGGERVLAPHRQPLGEAIAGGARRREIEAELGAVDRQHGIGPGRRRDQSEAAL